VNFILEVVAPVSIPLHRVGREKVVPQPVFFFAAQAEALLEADRL
jgi:hypothetical protein